jgi:hypothetical protein
MEARSVMNVRVRKKDYPLPDRQKMKVEDWVECKSQNGITHLLRSENGYRPSQVGM